MCHYKCSVSKENLTFRTIPSPGVAESEGSTQLKWLNSCFLISTDITPKREPQRRRGFSIYKGPSPREPESTSPGLLRSLGRSHSRFPGSVNAGQILTAISPSRPRVQVTLLLSLLCCLKKTFINASQGAACWLAMGWHHSSWICWAKYGMYFGCTDMYDTYKSGWQALQRWRTLLDWWSFDDMPKILPKFFFKKQVWNFDILTT